MSIVFERKEYILQPKNSVKVAAVIVMTSIFISRILGFVREMLIASIFGRGIETDAFYAAFTIPDVMFYLLIGGTLSSAFIPVFMSYIAKDDEQKGWDIASNFTNIIMICLIIFTVLGMIFTPYLVPLVAYKFKGEQLELTIRLTRIMFPAVAFTCLAGLQAGILNAYHKFLASSFGPIAYNLGIIFSLIVLGKSYGIEGIAYGVVVSAFLNFIIQFFALSKKTLFYSWIFNLKQEGLNQIIRLAIPSIIGLSISQLNLIITQNMASGFDEGSITALRYANILMSLPVGIFAMGISTAIFPSLTRQVARDEMDDYKESFSLGIRTIFFITIPSSIGLLVLKDQIIRLLFANGQFNENDVRITAYVLLFFCIGIAFSGGVQLLIRGFYSIRDTITPLKIGAITIILNIIFNLLFIKFSNLGIGGLSLATSLVSIFNMIALFLIFNKKIHGVNGRRIAKSFTKTLISSTIMGGVIYTMSTYALFNTITKLGQTFEVFALMGIGILIFTLFSMLLKMEEMSYVVSIIKSKLRLPQNEL